MPIGLLFWFLFIIYIIFGGWLYTPSVPTNYRPFGGHLLLCILIFLLGWKEFGFIVK